MHDERQQQQRITDDYEKDTFECSLGRGQETAAANNIYFTIDDEFYQATRGALQWVDPVSDGCGPDPGRMLLEST